MGRWANERMLIPLVVNYLICPFAHLPIYPFAHQTMPFSSIEEIFAAFDQLRVLIVGDVMVDSYQWGKVERISPEAPVPIVRVQRQEKRLGGAANVALNVQALGAVPVLCSVIGDDAEGNSFFQLLAESEIGASGMVSSLTRTTTIKHRILAGSQHVLRIDSEMDEELSGSERTQLLNKIEQLLPSCDVVLFEDYDKGVLNETIISQLIQLARQQQIPTVVDPKKRNFLNYHRATLFKPNLKELREGLKIEVNASRADDIRQAVTLLREKLQLEAVLVTLSERGMYVDFAGEQHLIPAHVRQIADVSGAGDTVVSIAALCLALRLPPQLLASLANLGGGLVCEHAGVVPVHKESLLREARKYQFFETYAAHD